MIERMYCVHNGGVPGNCVVQECRNRNRCEGVNLHPGAVRQRGIAALREHTGVHVSYPPPLTFPLIVPEMLDNPEGFAHFAEKIERQFIDDIAPTPRKCPHCGVATFMYGCFCEKGSRV